MSFRRVGSDTLWIYRKEVRSLVRDRHTLIYSVVLPMFLYPALVWGTVQSLSYVKALDERRISNVMLFDGTAGERLAVFLEGQGKLRVSRLDAADADAPEARMQAVGAQAALVYRPEGTGSPERAAQAKLFFSGAKDVSTRARDRLLEALEAWRKNELRAAALEAGEAGDIFALLEVREENLASKKETARFTAAMILPIISIVMLVLGAMYPALEVTVGERERGTLETTLVSPTSREALVAGKYLAVVTFTVFAFVMNAASLSFTLYHLSAQMKSEAFTVDLSASTVLVGLGCALLLSMLLAALLMLLAFAARTFKEGQAYLAPVYVLTLAPAMLVASSESALSPTLACAPVVNLLFLFREALRGHELGWPAIIAFAVSLLYAGLALWLSSYLLRRESYVTGESPTAGFPLFSRFRRVSPVPSAPESAGPA